MADSNSAAPAATGVGGKLKSAFKSVAGYVFSKHTLIHLTIMMGMVFGPVAASALAVGKTAAIGDVALGGLDMVGSMFNGWFENGELLGDVFNNAVEGNFAAQSYQMGTMDMAHQVTSGFSPTQAFDIQNQATRFGVDPVTYAQGYMPTHKG